MASMVESSLYLPRLTERDKAYARNLIARERMRRDTDDFADVPSPQRDRAAALAAEGLNSFAIGRRMGISPVTVRRHLQRARAAA
jgi:DNA-directed RNA polymerase specialized sigma24 family protein